jgi:hypothetical protein
MIRPFLTLALSLMFVGAAAAAPPSASDDDMVRLCRQELEARLFQGGTKGEAFVTAKEFRREADGVTLHLALASGEGRTTAGSCIFRDGKLFDVK